MTTRTHPAWPARRYRWTPNPPLAQQENRCRRRRAIRQRPPDCSSAKSSSPESIPVYSQRNEQVHARIYPRACWKRSHKEVSLRAQRGKSQRAAYHQTRGSSWSSVNCEVTSAVSEHVQRTSRGLPCLSTDTWPAKKQAVAKNASAEIEDPPTIQESTAGLLKLEPKNHGQNMQRL